MRTKKKNKVEKIVEETKVEETKVEETKVEETKVEETKVEETKVEETKVEETKVEETKVEETKVEETKVEETKVEETKVEETKVEETKVEETKVEEPTSEYEIIDSSDLAGEHKKKGRKKGSTNSTKEAPQNEDDLGGFSKEELFTHFIDFVEKANGSITSLFTKKDPERYNFNPFLKMILLAVAFKQKKFLINVKFISETWFFLAVFVFVLLATHVQVIMEDRMNATKTE